MTAKTKVIQTFPKISDHTVIVVNEIRKASLDTQAQIEDVMAEVDKLKKRMDEVYSKVQEVRDKQDKV